MRVLIDATKPQALWRVWGMTLLERLLRQLDAAGVDAVVVRGAPAGWRASLRRDLRLRLRIEEVAGELRAVVLTLEVDAAAVYDARLLRHLLACDGPTTIDEAPFVRVAAPFVAAEAVSLAALPTYVPGLRRHQVPYAVAIETRADLARAERLMFDAIYKGVTDVVTKYVYPGIVRAITRRLAPTSITPNQVTAVSMVLSFGAIPAFATGHLAVGLVMGFVMSVLDSVDGKLARLTLRESRTGNWMDHGSDFVYFGLWLVAVGVSTATGVVAWLLPAAWLVDRLITIGFHRRHGRELNDWGPIDAAFRLVVIRRNVFLVTMTAGVLAGRAPAAITVLAAWTLIGLAFHAGRALWIELTAEPPRASRLHGGTP